jgi:5'-methylthioinosine phosphorylase
MLAIIGGSGLSSLDSFEQVQEKAIKTPYARARVRVNLFTLGDTQFAFLPRHGKKHAIPPHKVNYRANIWALSSIGAKQIVAINAVGGIHDKLGPGSFAVPDQLIDYSFGRDGTFFETGLNQVTHIDFSHPYTETLRQQLLHAVNHVNKQAKIQRALMNGGVYACTQGPRLETAAEIQRLQRDGCAMVGMTGMPEAALARELDIAYACLALSVNWAAGLAEELISLDEIHRVLAQGMDFVLAVLEQVVKESASA